jgi:hypothetical protein
MLHREAIGADRQVRAVLLDRAHWQDHQRAAGHGAQLLARVFFE